MALLEQIEADLQTALKSKDLETLSVLRFIKSAIKNAEISKGGPLTEAESISVVEKQAKQRRDSIEQFEKGNRPDLADKERNELIIIEGYLPKKMSKQELENIVDETISELQAEGMSDMGRVIKEVLGRVNGSADGGTVSGIVREKLS